MKFNVCVLQTSIHTQCFAEVADSIEWALKELGHEATRGTNGCPGPNEHLIIFGLRPEDVVGGRFPASSIIYNGEQVHKDGMWPTMTGTYKRYTVWDYSAANAARYKDWGLAAPKVVRPGYSPVLEGRIQQREKLYDVVFFGSSNERREHILRGLEWGGLKVLRVPFGTYGCARDELIAQAKLCINIHFYESAIFEAVRCSYLAQNGVHVLSEHSVADEGAEWGMPGVAYEDLVRTATNYIKADCHQEMGVTQRNMVQGVSLLDDMRAAVENLEASAPKEDPAWEVLRRTTGWVKPAGPEITLCMIVKDEAAVIERCLASVKPLLSRWCIVDTGSTDGTQEVIRKFMADVPGQLHECSWKEFDGSRNDAFGFARAGCNNEGWLMLIDADETCEVDGALELPDNFDCYNAWVTRCKTCTPWARPMFVRANKQYYFLLPRHEGLYCHDVGLIAPTPVPNVLVTSTHDGARAKEDGYDRFMRDARMLEYWLSKNPGHPATSRAIYYIGQSYQMAADSRTPPDRAAAQKAVTHYLRRADMADYAQEAFSARYQAARCMNTYGYPQERIQQTLLQAFAMRPTRAEPLYTLARYYRELGDHDRAATGRATSGLYAVAEMFARRASLIGPSDDYFQDVDHSVNEWCAKDELATALMYLNGHAEARELNRHILRFASLSPHDRQRIEANLAMCLRVAPEGPD